MTTTTADKGEQECRESFEQWVLESWDATHLRTDRVGTYVCLHIFLRWQAWQACWNRRPTCEQQRTTNEGQDGLTDSIVDRIIEDAGIPHRGKYSYALAQAIAKEN